MNIEAAIAACEANENVGSYHIDCFDGVAIDSPLALTSFGPHMMKAIRKCTEKELNVHLIVSDPIRFVEEMENIGIDAVIVHYGRIDDVAKFARRVAEGGVMKCGLSLDPEFTFPNAEVEGILGGREVDIVVVMTVPIGFGGAAFVEGALEKIGYIRERFPHVKIHVDGGVNDVTAKVALADENVDAIVAGTYIFGGGRGEIDSRINALSVD